MNVFPIDFRFPIIVISSVLYVNLKSHKKYTFTISFHRIKFFIMNLSFDN